MIQINNELKGIIPPLTSEEYKSLEQSILAEGCREAIILWNDIIVDGHNRYEICSKHNIEFKTIQKKFDDINDVKEWIIDNQMARRNISAYQRTILALTKEAIIEFRAKEKQKKSGGAVPQISAEPPIDTREEIAKLAGVSHDTISKVKTIQEKATEKEKQDLQIGNTTINKVHKRIRSEEKKEEKIKLLAEASETFQSTDIQSWYGDFYELSKNIEDNSIDSIITDPPYPEEYLSLWQKLFEISYQKLKPSGFLVAYTGQMYLDKIFQMKNDLLYYWTMKLDFTSKPLIQGRNLINTWKPVLVFQKPPFKKIGETLEDTVKEYTPFNYEDRTLHEENWGQAIGNFEYLIDKFTKPGDLIVDTFSGTGTTLVAAQRMKRKCIGIEIDEAQYKKIIEGRLTLNK